MNEINSHLDLDVYKYSVDTVVRLYELTDNFPGGEKFGLVSQIRRAAVSIVANIAEGAERQTTKEFIQFLYISKGSCSEVKSLLEISMKLKMVSSDTYEFLLSELNKISKMLFGLIKSLKRK